MTALVDDRNGCKVHSFLQNILCALRPMLRLSERDFIPAEEPDDLT